MQVSQGLAFFIYTRASKPTLFSKVILVFHQGYPGQRVEAWHVLNHVNPFVKSFFMIRLYNLKRSSVQRCKMAFCNGLNRRSSWFVRDQCQFTEDFAVPKVGDIFIEIILIFKSIYLIRLRILHRHVGINSFSLRFLFALFVGVFFIIRGVPFAVLWVRSCVFLRAYSILNLFRGALGAMLSSWVTWINLFFNFSSHWFFVRAVNIIQFAHQSCLFLFLCCEMSLFNHG